MWTAALLLALTADAAATPIDRDEMVILFPTLARREGDGWLLEVHGWIFEPERDSLSRRALLGVLRRTLQLTKDDPRYPVLVERARLFLVDNERGAKIPLRVGATTHVAGASHPNGHFRADIRLTAAEVRALLHEQELNDGWLRFEAVARPGDGRRFAGKALLLEETGWSVISDIDDTIKISQVIDRRALLANTFLRPFRPVPGMADLYRPWAKAGARFHYVSQSPWQLYPLLDEFVRAHGYPEGTFHLNEFRVKDGSLLNAFADPEKAKARRIEPLLKAYPKRKFLFVGDASERDPELYARLARAYPDQVRGVYILDPAETPDAQRYRRAFEGVPRERWHVFRDPGTLRGEPAALFRKR